MHTHFLCLSLILSHSLIVSLKVYLLPLNPGHILSSHCFYFSFVTIWPTYLFNVCLCPTLHYKPHPTMSGMQMPQEYIEWFFLLYILLLLPLSYCSVIVYMASLLNSRGFLFLGHSMEFMKCLIDCSTKLQGLSRAGVLFCLSFCYLPWVHILGNHHDAISLVENLNFTSSTWTQQEQFKCRFCSYGKSLSYALRLTSTPDLWKQT